MIETEADMIDFLIDECHYLTAKITPDGTRWVATANLFATVAILSGKMGDTSGYDNRWCYMGLMPALRAYNHWDGDVGEPEGWHRHPSSGRRVALEAGEFDEDGNLIAVGSMYVRH